MTKMFILFSGDATPKGMGGVRGLAADTNINIHIFTACANTSMCFASCNSEANEKCDDVPKVNISRRSSVQTLYHIVA